MLYTNKSFYLKPSNIYKRNIYIISFTSSISISCSGK